MNPQTSAASAAANEPTRRNRNATEMPMTKNPAATKFGRAKGYILRNTDPPNKSGCFSAGLAKAPPKDGPKILPIVQTSGMILNARGWSSRSGTISATMVRMIPTLPFIRPVKARVASTIRSVCDMPSMIDEIIVQVRQVMMIGLRPT